MIDALDALLESKKEVRSSPSENTWPPHRRRDLESPPPSTSLRPINEITSNSKPEYFGNTATRTERSIRGERIKPHDDNLLRLIDNCRRDIEDDLPIKIWKLRKSYERSIQIRDRTNAVNTLQSTLNFPL